MMDNLSFLSNWSFPPRRRVSHVTVVTSRPDPDEVDNELQTLTRVLAIGIQDLFCSEVLGILKLPHNYGKFQPSNFTVKQQLVLG